MLAPVFEDCPRQWSTQNLTLETGQAPYSSKSCHENFQRSLGASTTLAEDDKGCRGWDASKYLRLLPVSNTVSALSALMNVGTCFLLNI